MGGVPSPRFALLPRLSSFRNPSWEPPGPSSSEALDLGFVSPAQRCCQNPRLALKPLNSHFPRLPPPRSGSASVLSTGSSPGGWVQNPRLPSQGSPSHQSLSPLHSDCAEWGDCPYSLPRRSSVPLPSVSTLDAVNGQSQG